MAEDRESLEMELQFMKRSQDVWGYDTNESDGVDYRLHQD
jgi:hypothetical protein